MAFEALKAEIMILLDEMETQPKDNWEAHEQILERLSELKALGMPLPQDLVELEAVLSAELNSKTVKSVTD